MLRLLIEQFTRDIRLEMRLRAQRTVTTIVWSVIAGMLALVGLIFLLVAAALGLTPELGPAGATAAVGGGTLLIAGFAALAARPRQARVPRAPTFVAPPPIVSPAADPSAMRQEDKSSKTGMAIAGAALLAGLILGRRL